VYGKHEKGSLPNKTKELVDVARLTGKKKEQTVTIETGDPNTIAKAIAGVSALAKEIDKRNTKKSWEKWTVTDVLKLVAVPEGTDKAALKAYVTESIVALKSTAPTALGFAPADFIIQSIEQYIADGGLETSEADDVEDDDDAGEQPIISVTQEEAKIALKSLLSTSNEKIALYYRMHEQYNKEFFDNKLSTPVITIDKLNNRTLGNYTAGQDRMALTNHIRCNHNFVALNTEERVLETLRHEMIHQWQDEVLYIEQGSDKAREIDLPSLDEEGSVIFNEGMQKKRVKEWHNADFKLMAKWVGIPAIGAKCYGNEAKMPDPVSYNKKFVCGCVASNMYPLTIYSTRPINAICQDCLAANPPRSGVFREVEKQLFKSGKTIEVSVSHIEKPGQDAVMDAMLQSHTHFERFKKKGEKDDFVERLKEGEIEEQPVSDMKEGVYQKNHNMYGVDYRYWIAYSTSPTEDKMSPDELRKAVEGVTKMKGGKKKPDPKPTATPAAEDGKKTRGKIVKFPNAGDTPAAPPAPKEREYSVDNPQDILDLYDELRTTRKVAEKLGIGQSTLSGKAKKMGIDWNELTFNKDWNK
jgi:hypothetical protein